MAEVQEVRNVAQELRGNMESPWRLVWKRFKKNKLALIGLVILTIIALCSIFAPFLTKHDPYKTNILDSRSAPNSKYWLGTDSVGRDIYTRLLYGGRISLTVGLVSMSISVLIGTILGSIAGYYGGWIDNLICRLVDIFNCFPTLILAPTVMVVFGPSIYNVMIVIGLLSWQGTCRLVRGEFLSLREREFVEAARALGEKDFRIIFKHILPNAFAPIIVSSTLKVAYAILLEASLSFLGIGVQPPIPSWGNMLTEAKNIVILEDMPWFWIPPGIMVILSVLSINFIGDGLRDALDPKLKE
ncbi:peptide ABC transporter permease [Anoxybacter fermentans]|uniref:Peptide ABC transporter permease n=1 Tax=Anoxybacter fermentans TaxID=1323375 RepID=A0A3S9SWC8_9FIRM|nr:oligopeptide ABC transporter permease [Anoxybacter fermentans]AZR72591.1 peptide ABC transporter permease [Anoxybacter fermentans]